MIPGEPRRRGTEVRAQLARWVVPALVSLVALAGLPAASAAQPDEPVPPEHEGYTPDDSGSFDGTGSLADGDGFPSFNESAGCGPPATSNPLATKMGSLSSSERIRGYRGDFFGRTVGQLSGQLVNWSVPLSDGKVVKVHRRALPAFQRAGANLIAAAAKNPSQPYRIRSSHTATYVPRTVGGSYSISNHTFGATIDINWDKNPYRSDNKLITDMPQWFIQAWRDAGFCWGGDWLDIKDTMHFSWKGPLATPGYGTVPKPFPPATSPTAFGTKAASFDVKPLGASKAGRPRDMADLTGNGLVDVAEATDIAGGISIRYSRTHRLHRSCAAASFVVPGITRGNRKILFGDYERYGRNDVWLLDVSGDKVQIKVALRSTDFEKRKTINTAVTPSGGAVYLLADHNRDGIQDLYVVRRSTQSTRVEVWNGAGGFQTRIVNATPSLGDTRQAHFAIGDRNVDDMPDLYVVHGKSLRILYNGYTSVNDKATLPASASWADIAVNDYDGDGRDDLFLLHGAGILDVYLGNTKMPGASLTSWFVPANWTCTDTPDDTYNGWCDISQATHVGTDGNDVIYGTAGDDVIFGGKGRDKIYGRGGNDVLCGGAGNDVLYGGGGVDRIFAGAGNDVLVGDAGSDYLFGEGGSDTLRGVGGHDRMDGGSGMDTLRGGTGDDILEGGSGADEMSGGAGADRLAGGGGSDIMDGGPGDDVMAGDGGHDVLDGGTGHDTMSGGTGNDKLRGHAGRDTLSGGTGNDILTGGDGHDELVGGAGDDVLRGGAGNDWIRGGGDDDTLSGHAGDDRLYGGVGNDSCSGGHGTDIAVSCEKRVGVP